ncbi:MAG TPA: aminotransferase class V-fold PLP-dependent enzyme, partial [Phototrophicaceae bacterium]|nr:aminotransferase class V-fold PLP-dependent enzyme [Phototrophicaceae bacterium]
YTIERSFVERHQWLGTLDPAAWLSVPAAIDFQREHDWDTVRRDCHQLLIETQQRLTELTGLAPVVPESAFAQMVIAQLPACDLPLLKQRLYDEYCVEVPLTFWNNRNFVRVSLQAYNTPADVDALLEGLRKLL